MDQVILDHYSFESNDKEDNLISLSQFYYERKNLISNRSRFVASETANSRSRGDQSVNHSR